LLVLVSLRGVVTRSTGQDRLPHFSVCFFMFLIHFVCFYYLF